MAKWKLEKRIYFLTENDKDIGAVWVDYRQPMGSKGKFYRACAGIQNLGEFDKLRDAKEAVARAVGE